MDAFHSFWSLPNSQRHDGSIYVPDYEQLTAVISALKWQEHSGSIRMITDSRGREYFDSVGLSSVWNGVYVSLDELQGRVDPFLFWAAGKLSALSSMDMPCVMLDTDIIIWRNVDDITDSFDITAAHPEMLNEDVYPDRSVFKLKDGYEFPSEWDFSLDAANTAFLCIKDRAFADYYTSEALRFFENVSTEGLNPVTAMCFAEQRVLPMCAAARGMRLGYLMHPGAVDMQDIATHIWGFKQILETMPEARYEFCMRCVRRIAEDFPERFDMLGSCRDLESYYREYKKKTANGCSGREK